MCRVYTGTISGEKSLTAEYCDFIQYYRKNSDLSADAKEKIKTALSRARNSYREVFVKDYQAWIKGKSITGNFSNIRGEKGFSISHSSFCEHFRTGKQFRMGKKYGAVSFLQILAPELNDRLLADFLDMESSLIVSMHIQSVDQVKAIKTVKRKITDLDRSKIEEQKKAVRAGYDMDIIPSDLATYGSEAKKLLQDLQSRNERMFLLTFLVLNTAESPTWSADSYTSGQWSLPGKCCCQADGDCPLCSAPERSKGTFSRCGSANPAKVFSLHCRK